MQRPIIMTFATKFDLPPYQIHAIQSEQPGRWIHGDMNQAGQLFSSYNKRRGGGYRETWSSPESYFIAQNKKNESRREKYDHRYGPSTTTPDLKVIETLYKCAFRLSRCLGIKFHVDHIFPLSKGGSPHQQNMQIITGALNTRKHAKMNYVQPMELQSGFSGLSSAA